MASPINSSIEEFTAEELVQTIGSLGRLEDINWIHFEGRIPDVLHTAILQIRSLFPSATLSIEFEKPNRPGLMDLLPFADVIFFSHSYFTNFQPEIPDVPSKITPFFQSMRKSNLKATFIVTAGERGAFYSTWEETGIVSTRRVDVIDATGAGDAFIAAFVWARGNLRKGVKESIEIAVALATRKVSQEGFDGVWASLEGTDAFSSN